MNTSEPQNVTNLIASANTEFSNSNSTQLTGSSEDPSTDGENSVQGQSTQLDFAKREISDNQGRNSYSQLSSLTSKSPDFHNGRSSNHKKHKRKNLKEKDVSNMSDRSLDDYNKSEKDDNQGDDEDEDPIVETDHQERIKNPASTVYRRSDHRDREKIGFRQPFGNNENESMNSSDKASHQPGTSTQNSPSDAASTYSWHTNQRRKPYEPAQVVLHKNDLGVDYSNSNNGVTNSKASSRSGSIVPLSRLGSPETSTQRGSIPQSLVSSLSTSPDDNGNTPLKQLREPKQPIYIPAVLRPTDFNLYHSQIRGTKCSSDAPRKPITQHWVRDANASNCRACEREFTWYRRRHHCRKCGGVFCSNDTRHTIGLDRVLNFNILGIPCRACDNCAAEFSGFCLDAPRLRDGPVATQQPVQGPELEEAEVVDGGDWSTF